MSFWTLVLEFGFSFSDWICSDHVISLLYCNQSRSLGRNISSFLYFEVLRTQTVYKNSS